MSVSLSLQNFSQLVQYGAAAVQKASAQLLDFTVGSVIRALLEANASVALWMQWLILQVLSMTRLATSQGTDVDTWVGDFALTRLPAVASSGAVTFSRAYTGTQALIQPGANVKTSDGTQTFTVTTDTTNAAWSTSLSGYVLPIGQASVSVPVQDTVAGSVGNVSAGSISLLATAISGVDTVTNPLAYANGIDAETDAALRARFVNYIGSLSKATLGAVEAAIASVQQGLTYSVAENVSASGAYQPGNFVVTIDDGTGAPSTNLKATVYSAIDAVRPIGSTFSVQSPTVVNAAVSLTITVGPGGVKSNIVGPVAQAITSYIDTLAIGQTLPYSRIAQIAYSTSSYITNVTSVTVNGGTADVVPGTSGVVKLSSIAVN